MQIKTEIVSCHTANSKPVTQEFNGTVILLPPLVFPVLTYSLLQQVELVYKLCYLLLNLHHVAQHTDIQLGSAKANGREPETCLGRIFNYKLGCFDDEQVLIYLDARPYLMLKTQSRFSPGS